MGLPESDYRPFFVPETERTTEINSELKEEFHHLLSEGGIITRSGNILPVNAGEILPRLPEASYESLQIMPVQKTTFKKLRPVISGIIDIERAASNNQAYIFNRNAIKRLSYKEFRRQGIVPTIIGYDGSYTPLWVDGHFPTAMTERTKRVLGQEGHPGSYYRFTALILKEFADNEGLGSMSSPKAQEELSRANKPIQPMLL